MEARAGIENTLHRYAWDYDMSELDDIGECFTAEAEVIFEDTGLKVGRAAVVEELTRRRDLYPSGTQPFHVISNVYISRLDQDAADLKSFYTFLVERVGEPPTVFSIGYYDDAFRLESGAWRVHRRTVRGLCRT